MAWEIGMNKNKMEGWKCVKEEDGDVGLKVCAFVARKLTRDIFISMVERFEAL